MNRRITIENAKSYSTEANLDKALARLHLTDVCRYVVCRTPDGRWTAVFLVTEWAAKEGGYVGFASQHGFMSV